LPNGLESGDADAHLAALIAEHHRFNDAIEMAQDAADEANAAERRVGGAESSRVAALYRRVETLHHEQGGVANTILTRPAASFVGVAAKLMLWRHEAALCFEDDFDNAHESFVFSAYQDVLRLTGLQYRAHPKDRATRRRMTRYWQTGA
jgi:hypothetical protein